MYVVAGYISGQLGNGSTHEHQPMGLVHHIHATTFSTLQTTISQLLVIIRWKRFR